MDDKENIAYHNKDIMSKVLTEEFKGKSFEAYGVHLPKIVDSRPTEMAAVEANELRLDRLFELEDGSYLIVDYESDYTEAKKAKYLSYVARLSKTLYNELGHYPKLRILILYTADVTRSQTRPDLFLGDFTMHIEEAFLSELDSEEILSRISSEIDERGELDDKELMQLIIYPLTYRKNEDKRNAIQSMIEISDRLKNEKRRIFALTGLLVFCDKVILDEDAEKIRRMIMMTKVEQIIEREKQEAIAQATAEVTAEVTAETTMRVTQSVSEKIARNLIKAGSSAEFIADNTGLSLNFVQELMASKEG